MRGVCARGLDGCVYGGLGMLTLRLAARPCTQGGRDVNTCWQWFVSVQTYWHWFVTSDTALQARAWPSSRCVNMAVLRCVLARAATVSRYRRKHRKVDLNVLKRWAWQILQGALRALEGSRGRKSMSPVAAAGGVVGVRTTVTGWGTGRLA
eukprot:354858-Chlamydomonas_euryale.AAC.1